MSGNHHLARGGIMAFVASSIGSLAGKRQVGSERTGLSGGVETNFPPASGATKAYHFDFKALEEDILQSRNAALKAGCPVAQTVIHEGRRMTMREWPDGRVERLTDKGWEEWPEWVELMNGH